MNNALLIVATLASYLVTLSLVAAGLMLFKLVLFWGAFRLRRRRARN